MPQTLVPLTIVNTTPNVSITPVNVTYNQILNSLGDNVYFSELLYLWSTEPQQLQSVIQYTHYDANGKELFLYLTPKLDPYQSPPSLFFDTSLYKLVIDGRSSFNFGLLPNVVLQMTFYGNRLAKQDYLNLSGVNNFIDLQRTIGLPKVFDGYTDILY